MIKTALPELNDLLGGGFPSPGLSLVIGEPGSGKTMLLMDTVAQVLTDPGKGVAVICDLPELWERRLEDRLGALTLYDLARPPAFLKEGPDPLFVVDGLDRVPDVRAAQQVVKILSGQKPVIASMTNRGHTGLGFGLGFQSALTLLVKKVDQDSGIVEVLKNRVEVTGEKLLFNYRSVSKRFSSPAVSRWERLVGEDLL